MSVAVRAAVALAVTTGRLRLPHIDYLSILPVMVMLGGGVVILVWSSLLRRPLDVAWVSSLTVLTATAALVLSLFQWDSVLTSGAHTHIDGAVVMDGASVLIGVLVSSAVLLTAMVGDSFLKREGVEGPELHVLLLVSGAGAMIMGSANDLIVIFLGLEILSIALYVLAAFDARRAKSGEAGLKYFVLGGFSSAIFVYGIALVYGATGSTNLPEIAAYLARNVLLHDGLLLAGLGLLLVGFGFKVALVPFHLWTPDVYEGSPTPVTGFMAAVAKAGGFIAFLRVFASSFHLLAPDWRPPIWVLACVTLLLGAVVALWQQDVKRMLAYSSINHAGFVLLGLQAATSRGVSAALYYLFVYSVMVIGTFAVVTVVGGRGDRRHGLEAYRGLAARQPLLAGALTVLLLAQAGVPFTTGFVAKLEVIRAAVSAGSTDLAVVAMGSAAIAAFFYLRVVLLCYQPARPAEGAPASEAPGVLGGPTLALADLGAESAAVLPGSAALAAPVPEGLGAGQAGAIATVAVAEAETPAVAASELEDETDPLPAGAATTIVLSVLFTVLFGIWVEPVASFAAHATLLVRP
ncbi:NADH-quinone oxidoreductase subunit NuoN [Aciditerrimonas ferrireducens]|uniref:NADH-quinone oxidoreductase subunit N n=1 Tax=Aciditerrimonas ferrireducens TaxID=667306 RepID=A0ABV6C3L3_9ACTN